MYHYMEFDPYLIRERNEQIRCGVNSLRLQEQLRKNHKVHGSRLAAFALRLKVTLRLLCRVALAGRQPDARSARVGTELRHQGEVGDYQSDIHTGHKDERFERKGTLMIGYIGVEEQVDKDFNRAFLKASLHHWKDRLLRASARRHPAGATPGSY